MFGRQKSPTATHCFIITCQLSNSDLAIVARGVPSCENKAAGHFGYLQAEVGFGSPATTLLPVLKTCCDGSKCEKVTEAIRLHSSWAEGGKFTG